MPRIELTYPLKTGQSMADAFDTVRELLEAEKAKVAVVATAEGRPVAFARHPEWRDEGHRLIAILPYDD